MAAPNTNNIGVLDADVTGAVFIAPTSATLPTSASATLTGFTCLGFTSDDGITITESSSSKSLRVWEGKVEVANRRTEYTEQLKFTSVECSMDVAKAMWGDSHVTGTADAFKVEHHGGTLDPVYIVIEAVPKPGFVARYCCKAQLTNRGDLTGNGEDFSGRELTFNCLAVNGVTLTEYVAKVTGTTTTGN